MFDLVKIYIPCSNYNRCTNSRFPFLTDQYILNLVTHEMVSRVFENSLEINFKSENQLVSFKWLSFVV
jgi:hypothetical protein